MSKRIALKSLSARSFDAIARQAPVRAMNSLQPMLAPPLTQEGDLPVEARSRVDSAKANLLYRQTLESIPGMVFTIRPDGYCDYQSQQWVEFTGIPMNGHLGHGWNQLLHPEDRERAYAVWRAAVEERADYDLEYRIRRHDGVYRWFKVRGRPIRNAEGSIVRWFGVALDIEALKHAEAALQKARDDLADTNAHLEHMVRERTTKLGETVAELEGFSYSLVHDMRAPLRAMLAYAGMLEMEAGPRLQPKESDLLRKISIAARRMDLLITDSLNYSRILRQDIALGPVNLGPLLRGIVETYPNLHPPQADVSIELDNVVVHGNQAALTQIFSNLLGNAVKFVAHGVHPRVRVWAEGCAPTAPLSPLGEEVKDEVSHNTSPHEFTNPSTRQLNGLICIEDNGIGIPQNQHEKIFGMFQRMHRAEEYPGTGIGLALVKKSLERTGGRITVESQPGKGSCLCVELPLAVQQSKGAPPSNPSHL